MRITWTIVVDDWDRATRRPDCPWDNSPSCCASSIPNPRIFPPGSISGRTLCPRRSHPPSSFVDLVDSRTLGASYPRCAPSGTISTWNRDVLKIPARIPCEKNRIAGTVGNVTLPRIIYRYFRTVISLPNGTLFLLPPLFSPAECSRSKKNVTREKEREEKESEFIREYKRGRVFITSTDTDLTRIH